MHASPAPVEARLRRRRQFSPAQVLVVSSGALIVLGAVLLRLPLAAAGEPLSFLDALFTATSAVCVTGLIVVDTPQDLTVFGQVVVLSLIQLGGLGYKDGNYCPRCSKPQAHSAPSACPWARPARR